MSRRWGWLSRATAVVLAALSACDRHVTVEPQGGHGAASSGGGEGGTPSVSTRLLTVRVEQSFDHTFLSLPLEGLLVFSNAPDGELLSSATTGADGVATLEVADGGFVSAVATGVGVAPPRDEIVTVRVVPGAESLRVPVETTTPQAEREPMSLRVEWDPLQAQDAIYRVHVSCATSDWADQGVSFTEFKEFKGCPGYEEFAIMVESQLPAGSDYEYGYFGYVHGLEYVPGGELSVLVPLEIGTEQGSWFVEGTEALADAHDVRLKRFLPGTVIGESGYAEKELVDGGLLVTTSTAAFSDLPVLSTIVLDAECSFTEVRHVLADVEPASLQVSRLAPAVAWPPGGAAQEGTGQWKLLDGEMGDAVELGMSWPDDDGIIVWRLYQPASPEGEVMVPELPKDALPDAVASPPSDMRFYAYGHLDVLEASDYVTFLEFLDSASFHRQELTYWHCDSPATSD